MQQQQLIPHLFRTEFSKITAVLCKFLGVDHIQLAEDIASETFLSALEVWTYNGIPENPTAWLYTVAKNKAINQVKRNKIFVTKVASELRRSDVTEDEIEIDLSEQNISDSQLQMLFTLCNPVIPMESQIGLSLRILCGFGIEEIANAFLTNKETINKRLLRAKEKLRSEHVQIKFPGKTEISDRLRSVLTTLYLLFNEGYYSESKDDVLREDLCLEAMRLTYLLINNKQTNLPEVNALFSLMCFHASRFPARKDEHGELVLYHDQDDSLWNRELISRGAYFLKQASQGDTISKYHLEAGIAYWHTIKGDTIEKWENILQLYNHLLQSEYSPVAALNRTFALSKVKGKEVAIKEAENLKLENNQYYHLLLGELYEGINNEEAKKYFEKALFHSKTSSEKTVIQNKIALL